MSGHFSSDMAANQVTQAPVSQFAQPNVSSNKAVSAEPQSPQLTLSSCMETPSTTNLATISSREMQDSFGDIWSDAISDYRPTLFGFQRFRTIHLVNLRYLELEIKNLDHAIFQAGLHVEQSLPKLDRLGLQFAKKEPQALTKEGVINRDNLSRLRQLLKEYDEAILSFNAVMSMETFAMADNIFKASPMQGVDLREKIKTRLLRVDQPLRNSSRDPIQHYLRKGIRRLWHRFNRDHLSDDEHGTQPRSCNPGWERTWGNTARIAEALSRFLMAIIAGSALVCPLAILSGLSSSTNRLIVVVVFIVLFSLVVSILSKATHYETMACSAAYAAVLTVFLSNNPGL